MNASPMRLNHAVLFVTDAERSARFYCEIFGMYEVLRQPPASAIFLRLPRSDNHHDLGLFAVGASAPEPPRGATGLYHLAWQVETITDLAHMRAALQNAGSFTGEADHGATKSIYGQDPDGIQFEVMWMLPREEWGSWESDAVVAPLDLTSEIERWG